ncbi:MAG: peptidoglycan DD-metalloendopeptidase family protein [Candidatus Andersenbacteria bacterium]
MTAVVWQSQQTTTIDRSSLLYSLISGEEITEGPLDPSAYAQTDAPGTGGARLAVVDASDVNLITFDDPEVTFAQTLGGNAVVAPLQPVVPEPGSEDSGDAGDPRPSTPGKPHVYTVQEDDTIAGIAAKFDVSVNTVLWANGLNSKTVIKAGDHITILPTTGVLHTVTSGDTVLGIANKYDAKAADVLTYNNLGDGSRLSIGQKLIVPDGYVEQRSAPAVVSGNTRIAREEESGPTPEPAPVSPGGGWVWPTTSKHISQYFRGGHTGIDIDNRSRPSVFASQGGVVEFRGWLGGYGNLIIINHGGGLTTYYAHLDAFYVAKGQKVSSGDAIGKMGSTGRSTGPHVHFEVRRNGKPTNPMAVF